MLRGRLKAVIFGNLEAVIAVREPSLQSQTATGWARVIAQTILAAAPTLLSGGQHMAIPAALVIVSLHTEA